MPDIIELYPYEQFDPQNGLFPPIYFTTSSSSTLSSSSSSSPTCPAACCTRKCVGACCPDPTTSPLCCQFKVEDIKDSKLVFKYTVENTVCCSDRCVNRNPPSNCIGECGAWHACDRARWYVILNDINLGIADLNNESDGLSRVSELFIDENRAKEIIKNNPCSLRLKLQCTTQNCHDSISYVEMILRDGVKIKCKDENNEDVEYGPKFFGKCITPSGLNALTNCPPEKCQAGKCYRLYDKIFSPESHYRNTIAGITTDKKLRFWGDKNYQNTMQEFCNSFSIPECSVPCADLVLYSDHGTYHKNSICPTTPFDYCTPQTAAPASLYKHISFTTRRIALVSNSNKAEFIPNAFCKDGAITNLNDYFSTKDINYICINDYNLLTGSVLDVPKILAVKTDGTLFTYDEPCLNWNFKYLDISSGTTWENCPHNYYLFGDRNLPIDIYYADKLHKDKTTGGNNRKIIQADFNEMFRIIKYDDNSIIINQTWPATLLTNGIYPEIGYNYSVPTDIPPTWKDDKFDYIHLNKEVITAIRTSDKKLFIWGMYINNYPSGNSHRFITRNLDMINTLTDTVNPFIKTIYYSKVDTISAYFPDVYQDDVLFALKQDGTLMIFGNEDILYLYGIALTDAEYPANPWKKVIYSTQGGVNHYYYTLKDTDIKFKDFTVTGATQDGSQNYPNISISCILESGNTDQLEGQTWCFSFSLYSGNKGQIGYYGEANCCYTAGRSGNA